MVRLFSQSERSAAAAAEITTKKNVYFLDDVDMSFVFSLQ